LTFRPTEKDLQSVVDRLNRNLESKGSQLRTSVVHQYNYLNLFSEDQSEGFSYGNTKTQLYYQVILACKMLESIKDKV
jgi:hypothetical protein